MTTRTDIYRRIRYI